MLYKKNSQLSLFFILGILLIVLILLFVSFSYRSGYVNSFMKETRHPIPYYVEECMKFQLYDAIELASDQGGFIYSYDPNLTTTKKVIAYSIYDGSNTSPSFNYMEEQISKLIESRIDSCIDNSSFFLNTTGEPDADTTIYPEKVYVELYYKITSESENYDTEFSEFNVEHKIPLGNMISLRDKIVGDMIEYPNLMILEEMYGSDFHIDVLPLSGDIKVIRMINTSARLRNAPLTFNFAVHERHSLPHKLNFGAGFPDKVIARSGNPINITIPANKKCDFKDDVVLFNIDNKDDNTGLIEYTPKNMDKGNYNVTITIDDGVYTVSRRFELRVI